MDRPRWNRTAMSQAEWAKVREDYVAAYRKERNKKQIIERTTEHTIETVREIPIVQPVEMDAEARRELSELRDTVAWLMMPGEVVASEPDPVIGPEQHFADLMLADETVDDAKVRLSQRIKELRHYLIAPEIRVNDDGSLGLTAVEQAELQDLERRQTLGRWLDA